MEKREYEAAVRETEKTFELGPDPEAEVNLAITYAVVRRRGEARTLLTKLQKCSVDLVSVDIAQEYASSGDKDEAFAALGETMQTRNGGLTLLKVVTFLDSSHSDPRFTDLARRIGLPK